ncbi:helix-turn-helix domain-containing protein [Streptomyces sp. NPDC001719]
MTAADLVRARRVALGLSQLELAARTGTGQAFISRVESGKVVPTIPVLQRLAAALECDVVLDFSPRP